eukprot:COSAG02_NODE_6286_length_3675_cov_2.106264_3_plen_70_part_00
MFLLSIVGDDIVVACTQAWGTGKNHRGQLGLSAVTSQCCYRSSPEMLPSPTHVVQISAGSEHTMLIAKV